MNKILIIGCLLVFPILTHASSNEHGGVIELPPIYITATYPTEADKMDFGTVVHSDKGIVASDSFGKKDQRIMVHTPDSTGRTLTTGPKIDHK